jgi:hypothetical protein
MQMDDSGDDEPDNDMEGLASLDAVLGATDDSGPPVSDKLATIMKRYGKKIEDSSLRALLGKYKIPNNCPSLGVPLTNQEVRSCLSSSVRRADTRILNTQSTLSKAATALAQGTDLVREASKKVDATTKAMLANCTEKLADARALTGHATHSLSL